MPLIITDILNSKPARLLNYWVRNFSLPGNKNVPLYDVLTYIARGIGNGALWRASKGLAFSFLMAIPPLLIFMFTLIAYLPVDGLQDELLVQLQLLLPDNIYSSIANTINDIMGHRHGSLLSIGFAMAIILAANAMHGMMMYFADRNNERRSFPKRYLICILLVFLLYFLVVLVLLLLVAYKTILAELFRRGIIIPDSPLHHIIAIGRWVLMIFMALLTVSIIYYVTPTKKQRVGFFSAGAVFATLVFFLLTWGFKAYISNLTNYNLLYGSIGTLLLIMLWLLLNSFVLMMGYELNAAILNGTLRGRHLYHHRLHHFRPLQFLVKNNPSGNKPDNPQ